MKYEIVKDELRNQDTLVRTNDDGTITYIPCNEANADYQAYLNSKAEQSTPIVINEAETI
jgi:hypothetical protein